MPGPVPTTFCRYYNQSDCRSCGRLEQTYEVQIADKEARIRSKLGISQLEPSFTSALQGFRNRAKMVVTGDVNHPVLGLIDQELLDCPIHHPKLNELMAVLPGLIQEYQLTPYRIEARTGELKGIIAFYSPLSRQMYVRFVLRSQDHVARIRALIPKLQARMPETVCISANLQPIPHAILEGPEEIFLTQRRWIEHRLGEVTLRLAPNAFVQTNAEVATGLYLTAARWIGELAPARVLELYCGQGAFSFFAASKARELLGIEINADAVQTANETAHERGLTHLKFKALDATQVGAETQAFAPELILANPPRRGLTPSGARLIAEAKPKQLLYSSCEIETLSSDLALLSRQYRIQRAQLFDMFPHTEHFETLVLLERI